MAEREVGVYVLDPSLSGDNINPSRTITKGAQVDGIPSQLDAFDVTVDMLNKEVFVTDITCGCVLVYPLSSSEETLPLRIISGLSIPYSWSLSEYPNSTRVDTRNDELLVLTSNGRIFIFPRTASGNISKVPPLRILTSQWVVNALAVDSTNDELLLATSDSIQIYRREADGNYTPLRSIMANPLTLTRFNGIAGGYQE